MKKTVTTSSITASPLPERFKKKTPSAELFALLPPDIAGELGAFVCEKNGEQVAIAAERPNDAAVAEYAERRFGKNVIWYQASAEDIAFALEHKPKDYASDIKRLSSLSPNANGNIAELVDAVIRLAFVKKASDIHIEPRRNESVVRFRVDGILHTMATLPKHLHEPVIARVKILADLKIDEYRRPQDGRIELEHMPEASLRASIVPTLFGEKAVLRVLDDSLKNFALDALGFSSAHQEILKRNAEKPFGMIVACGPTGSGKTTTLYALLRLLAEETTNISTLEDPIEFALPGVNQIQVNPRVDLKFASGLRALLRQDPDVIMVGEIRDTETVAMAANAAMTGHLVLTTMHTNDAPSAFVRFIEMKVEDFVVASIVNLVIAQRLVRQICASCAKDVPLDPAIARKVAERKDVLAALRTSNKDAAEDLEKRPFRRGMGCDACFGTGYAGRVGIYELLELDHHIHDLVLEHAPAERIKAAAEKEGFRDMIADGVDKVLAGKTTFEEILRTTRNS